MEAAISLTGGGSFIFVSLVGVAIGLTGGGGYWSHWWGQLLVSLVGVTIGLTGGGSY